MKITDDTDASIDDGVAIISAVDKLEFDSSTTHSKPYKEDMQLKDIGGTGYGTIDEVRWQPNKLY